jgi:proteasome lid subunit RPN8/RPN11
MAESDATLPPSGLQISQKEYRLMLDHLWSTYPQEGCGLLAGKDGNVFRIYIVENRLASPTAYEMDPQQQLEAMLDIEDQGSELLAIFHSHPGGPDVPSATDLATAYYPEAAYVIVSYHDPERPTARAFTVFEGRVEEIPLIVV